MFSKSIEDMRFYRKISVFILSVVFLAACGGASEEALPIESLRAYSKAVKAKDVKMMKTLLSAGSLKIHEQEAKAQNVSIDEIILRDTLFPPDQRVFEYRNQKIDGERATVEVENNFGGWDLIYLVREDGIWKIDKKGTSDQILNEVEEAEKALDEAIIQGREQANQDFNSADANLDSNRDANINTPLDNSNVQTTPPASENPLTDPNRQP